MFYVLNFQTHEFEPCGTMAQTAQKIRDFQSAGAHKNTFSSSMRQERISS